MHCQPLRRATLLALLAALALLFLFPVENPLDLKLLDAQQRWLRENHPRPATTEIRIVAITDRTTEALREPIALWHPHLGALLEALATARSAAVALDALLPTRSYDFLLPGNDRKLFAGLLALRRAGVPLVIARGVDGAGRLREIFPAILALLEPGSTGLVTLPTDRDQVIRRFLGTVPGADSVPLPTLAGAIAQRFGKQPESGIIDYTFGAPFSPIPLEQLLEWQRLGDKERLQAEFGGKVVLVGGVFPFDDRHAAPVSPAALESRNDGIPGVFVQGQILRNLLDERWIRPVPEWLRRITLLLLVPLCWHLGGRMAVHGVGEQHENLTIYGRRSTAMAATALLLLLPIPLSTWGLADGWHLPTATLLLAMLGALLLRLALEAGFKLQERRKLRASFGRYVSPLVVRDILEDRIRPEVGGESYDLCVLFSDIRNFTTRSEGQPPQQTIRLLNRYFTEMTAAVHNQGGTVDKFIGDGLMAFFGAPQPLANPSQAAFDAAREMLERLRQLDQTLAAEGIEPILIGIGIHRGRAVVGNIGSATRMEYTAIGDTVNVAARLEGLSKKIGRPVVISAAALAGIDAAPQCAPCGFQEIKGHSPVEVYGWGPATDNDLGEK